MLVSQLKSMAESQQRSIEGATTQALQKGTQVDKTSTILNEDIEKGD